MRTLPLVLLVARVLGCDLLRLEADTEAVLLQNCADARSGTCSNLCGNAIANLQRCSTTVLDPTLRTSIQSKIRALPGVTEACSAFTSAVVVIPPTTPPTTSSEGRECNVALLTASTRENLLFLCADPVGDSTANCPSSCRTALQNLEDCRGRTSLTASQRASAEALRVSFTPSGVFGTCSIALQPVGLTPTAPTAPTAPTSPPPIERCPSAELTASAVQSACSSVFEGGKTTATSCTPECGAKWWQLDDCKSTAGFSASVPRLLDLLNGFGLDILCVSFNPAFLPPVTVPTPPTLDPANVPVTKCDAALLIDTTGSFVAATCSVLFGGGTCVTACANIVNNAFLCSTDRDVSRLAQDKLDLLDTLGLPDQCRAATAAPTPAPVLVQIVADSANSRWAPAALVVPPGTTVRFGGLGAGENVVQADGPASCRVSLNPIINSGSPDSGISTFDQRFNTVGVVNFLSQGGCARGQVMTGSVTVVERPVPTPAPPPTSSAPTPQPLCDIDDPCMRRSFPQNTCRNAATTFSCACNDVRTELGADGRCQIRIGCQDDECLTSLESRNVCSDDGFQYSCTCGGAFVADPLKKSCIDTTDPCNILSGHCGLSDPANSCVRSGTTDEFTCLCGGTQVRSQDGSNCERQRTQCLANECGVEPGNTCVGLNDANDHICNCNAPGFTRSDDFRSCISRPDICAAQPCRGGGCQDFGDGTFACTCVGGLHASFDQSTCLTPGSNEAIVDEVLAIINFERQRAVEAAGGTAESFDVKVAFPLCRNERLQRAAMIHAQDQQFCENGATRSSCLRPGAPGGGRAKTVQARVTDAEYKFKAVADLVAYSQKTAKEVVDSWMANPVTRALLTDVALTNTGIGVAGMYWNMIFAVPLEGVPGCGPSDGTNDFPGHEPLRLDRAVESLTSTIGATVSNLPCDGDTSRVFRSNGRSLPCGILGSSICPSGTFCDFTLDTVRATCCLKTPLPAPVAGFLFDSCQGRCGFASRASPLLDVDLFGLSTVPVTGVRSGGLNFAPNSNRQFGVRGVSRGVRPLGVTLSRQQAFLPSITAVARTGTMAISASLAGGLFTPSQVTVPPGTTVTFFGLSLETGRITETTGQNECVTKQGGFRSLGGSATTWDITLKLPGTYTYMAEGQCPSASGTRMTGVIFVTEGFVRSRDSEFACSCDRSCRLFNDCCADYGSICSSNFGRVVGG